MLNNPAHTSPNTKRFFTSATTQFLRFDLDKTQNHVKLNKKRPIILILEDNQRKYHFPTENKITTTILVL